MAAYRVFDDLRVLTREGAKGDDESFSLAQSEDDLSADERRSSLELLGSVGSLCNMVLDSVLGAFCDKQIALINLTAARAGGHPPRPASRPFARVVFRQ